MKTTEISLTDLRPAPWNPNRMDAKTMARLKESITRYGLVQPLVVRPIGDGHFEILSGNQRFQVIQDMNMESVPCVVVELDDTRAMLLAQALNGLRGEDDLALKGNLLKAVLASVPEKEVLSLLPETAESLKSLSTINEANLAEHLKAWSQAQAARLRHLQVQLTDGQMDVVKEAISLLILEAREDDFGNPNSRGNAIYLLSKFYLERRESE